VGWTMFSAPERAGGTRVSRDLHIAACGPAPTATADQAFARVPPPSPTDSPTAMPTAAPTVTSPAAVPRVGPTATAPPLESVVALALGPLIARLRERGYSFPTVAGLP